MAVWSIFCKAREELTSGLNLEHTTHALFKSAAEHMRGGDSEVELQRDDHRALHSQDVVCCVGSCGHIDKLLDLRGIDLLVLGGQEHGSAADKLQARARNDLALEEPVDEVDTQVEGLCVQPGEVR